MDSLIHAIDERAAKPGTIGSTGLRRIKHALFAVVLVTVGYIYLGALLAEAL